MPAKSPSVARDAGRFSPSRFVIRVGTEWCPMRAAAIWPIADVVGGPGPAAAIPASTSPTGDTALVLDLIDSGMIAPPRPRRRRERSVSSRAVFYQAADA